MAAEDLLPEGKGRDAAEAPLPKGGGTMAACSSFP
jgi:hypothetical protein